MQVKARPDVAVGWLGCLVIFVHCFYSPVLVLHVWLVLVMVGVVVAATGVLRHGSIAASTRPLLG